LKLICSVTDNWKKKICLIQPFPDATKPNIDFYSRIPQTIQTLKGKSNPKQTHPKCKFNSSSFADNKYNAQTSSSSKVTQYITSDFCEKKHVNKDVLKWWVEF
jgi:hypothetical protein